MKHIEELAEIYKLLDTIQTDIKVAASGKAEADTIMVRLRLLIAQSFKRLEDLES